MVLFIYGSDAYRVKEKTQELITQFRQKRDSVGMNVVKLSGDTLTFDRLRQEVMVQGFLSEKKMIVIDRLLSLGLSETHELTLEFLKKFIKKKDEQNALLFIEGACVFGKQKTHNSAKKLFALLKKQPYIFELQELGGRKLEEWTINRASQLGGIISQQNAQILTSRVGRDLWRLSHELHKLIAFKQKQPITQNDIEQYTESTLEENIFTLTDTIAQRKFAHAHILLKRMLEDGANELYILTMIIRQYRLLLQLHDFVHTQKNNREIATVLKLHPFVVQKTLPITRNFTLPELTRSYQILLSIEQKCKQGHPNQPLLLHTFIENQNTVC